MKQSCPSLALVELLFNIHLLEASATDTRLVDFASVVCVFILFFDTGTRELSEMDPSLKMRSKKLLLTFTGFWGGGRICLMRFIFIACLFECLMVYDCSVTYVDVEILLTQYVVVSVAYVL